MCNFGAYAIYELSQIVIYFKVFNINIQIVNDFKSIIN